MTDRELLMTDRELMVAQREEAAQEAAAIQQIQHYRAQGLGMAAFALSMWQGLDESGLTREEKLAMITAALGGK